MTNHKKARIELGYTLLKRGGRTLKDIGRETSISQGDLKCMQNDIALGIEDR